MADDVDIPADEDLFKRALRHADEAWTAEFDNIDKGREDQAFAAGEQWLPAAKQERIDANRPVMTLDRTMSFVRQVTGDVRRDTPGIKVAPAKGPASEDMAAVYNGIIRNIQQQSNAKAAYVQATENACIVGLGNIKVVTEYSSDDSFEQDLRIKRIVDPFAVVWDPAAREPDKSDARYLHEYIDIPKEEFKRQYPKASPESMPSGPSGQENALQWYTLESVRVAQYWYMEPVTKILLQLADGRVLDSDQALAETKEGGAPLEVLNKRKVKTFQVMQVLMSGSELLTKPAKWVGSMIPYAPVIGTEIWLDGRCVRFGMIRGLKDAQRAYNYMRTAAIEASALQPKAPFIVAVEQIAGLETYWEQAGQKNFPYLPYNATAAHPNPPQRSQPALAQSGLDQQALLSADEMKANVGIYDASLGAKSNETSGRAILARQREGDTGTYHFIDNLATGIRRIGVILVDVIPKVYDTPRVVRVLEENGDQRMQAVNVPQAGTNADELGKIVRTMHDLAAGEYDVAVITGPSFATRRQESTEAMQELIRAAPAIMQAPGVASEIVKNMDFPGASEISKLLEPHGPPPPKPGDIAKAELDMANADLARSKTQGQEITNVTTFAQLQPMLASLQVQLTTLAQGIQMIGGLASPPPPGPPPGAPSMPPPAAAGPGPPPGGGPVPAGPPPPMPHGGVELTPAELAQLGPPPSEPSPGRVLRTPKGDVTIHRK